ncbi:hypothetical protein CHARACLAT_023946 [Characodon lateralis]|uniref:Uncharacterized protein n=1 Tax=Characodon lateralis TaxID=208331 RepID=A0ABU7D0Y3_9TELE|nr:hypothetical protein [Characodon lateralis]
MFSEMLLFLFRLINWTWVRTSLCCTECRNEFNPKCSDPNTTVCFNDTVFGSGSEMLKASKGPVSKLKQSSRRPLGYFQTPQRPGQNHLGPVSSGLDLPFLYSSGAIFGLSSASLFRND